MCKQTVESLQYLEENVTSFTKTLRTNTQWQSESNKTSGPAGVDCTLGRSVKRTKCVWGAGWQGLKQGIVKPVWLHCSWVQRLCLPIRALDMLAVTCWVGAAQEEPRRTGQMQTFTAAASGWLRIKCGVPWTAKAQTPYDSKDTSLMLCLSSTKRRFITTGWRCYCRNLW